MNNPVELLGQVVADLDAVLRSDVIARLADDEKMALLRVAGEVQRRVEAVVVEAVASVDERPAGSGEPAFCGRYGCRTVNELLQRVLRTDAAGAGRVVRAAKAVRREVGVSSGAWLPARWPALREALVGGTIGVAGLLAAIGPIEQAGSRVGTADRLRADAELAAYARGFAEPDAEPDAGGDVAPAATPEDLRLLAQVIVQYLDPDGAEPADDIAMRVRGLTLGRAKDGVIPVRGRLLPEVAGQLQRLFDAYLNPKVDGPPVPGVMFRPSGEMDAKTPEVADDGAGMDDDALPSGDPGRMVDTRSRSQKQHDTLAAILGIAARHDDTPRLGGGAPTLVVSVTADDYTSGRGWAHVDGIDPPSPLVSRSTPRARAGCNGCCSTRTGGSSASAPPTGSSPRISVARSPSATASASSPAATSPRPGARSTTSPSTPTAAPPTPTTASPSAGTTTEPSTPPDGRSACATAHPTSADPPGGTPPDDGAHHDPRHHDLRRHGRRQPPAARQCSEHERPRPGSA